MSVFGRFMSCRYVSDCGHPGVFVLGGRGRCRYAFYFVLVFSVQHSNRKGKAKQKHAWGSVQSAYAVQATALTYISIKCKTDLKSFV